MPDYDSDKKMKNCIAEAKSEMQKTLKETGRAWDYLNLPAQETALGQLVGGIGLDRYRACMAKPQTK